MDVTGLEPVTPTMSTWCSNQLSYTSPLVLSYHRQLREGKQPVVCLPATDPNLGFARAITLFYTPYQQPLGSEAPVLEKWGGRT